MHKLNYLLTLGRIAIAWPTPNADMLCLISLFVSVVHRHVTMTASVPCGAAVNTKQRLGFILSSEWDIQEINNTSEQARAVHMGRLGGAQLAKCSPKNSSSINHCSKSIFNNMIVTFTIYSLCRLSNYFWSVDITFWMMVAIQV